MKRKNEALTYNVQESAKRICDLRKAHGYTQKEAADLLGVNRSSLSHIEAGTRGCSVDFFVQLAKIYHVSTDYLILGKDMEGELMKEAMDAAILRLTAMRDALKVSN